MDCVPAEGASPRRNSDSEYSIDDSSCCDEARDIVLNCHGAKCGSGRSSTGTRSEANRPRKHPALEGGWAWAVVLSGFTLHVLTRGCLFSTGVLFSEWISFFGKSKRDTALVGSIATGCALMLGPLASRFIEKWGYRATAMAGGAISTVGFLCSYWANEVYYLYLTYGFLAGTGMGVSYLCGVVAVGEYFDERRSLAFGISAAGAGCGASVMAVLQRVLLEEYGWRGTMIILAGMSGLNQIAFGALLRPLSSPLNWKSKAGQKRLLNHHLGRAADSDITEVSKSSDGDTDSQIDTTGSLNVPGVRISGSSADFAFTSESDNKAEYDGNDSTNLRLPSHRRQRTTSDTCELIIRPLSPSLMLRRKIKQAYASNPSSPALLQKFKSSHSNRNLFESEECQICESSQTIAADDSDHRKTTVRRLKHAQKTITTGDAMYLSSISVSSSRAAVDNILSKNDLCGSESSDDQSVDESTEGSQVRLPDYDPEGDKEQPLIASESYGRRYLSLLKNPLFIILAVNQFFTALGIMVPFIHLAEKAILMGISESYAAYLVAIIGIGNVFGKVSLGYLCDVKWTDIFIVFTISQLGLAISVMMFPFFTSYEALVFASFLFGFFYGNYSAIPSLTAEYVGLHNLAKAIGYITFLEGLAGIIGPPLAGAIYDASLSYNVAFAVAAGFLVISTLVLGVQPYFYKRITGKRSSMAKLFCVSKYRTDTSASDKSSKKMVLIKGGPHTVDHNGNCLNISGIEKMTAESE